MAFVKYPSIDNYKHGLARKFTTDAPDAPWVALEKVHGCNFGLRCALPDKDIVLQRRNDDLTADDKFYGVHTSPMILDLKQRVRALFDTLAPDTREVLVFGELYGSNVQAEICYGPELRFACFDVCINGVFVAYDSMVQLCAPVNISCVPLLGREYLRLLVTRFDVETLQSALWPGAIAEGVVFRPAGESYVLGDRASRAILKHKRAAFTERKAPSLVDLEHDLLVAACDFVTSGRLASVRSKLLQDAPFYDVAMALAADAMLDVVQQAFWITAADALQKRIKKSVTNASFILVKSQ
jgi:Rnl2 family RNA ligase